MSDSSLKHGKYQLLAGSVIHPVQRKTEKKTANMREYLLGKEIIIRQLVHTPAADSTPITVYGNHPTP